jgi:cyclin B
MAEDGFTRDQLMAMERQLLKVIGFDLGAPLSYRFLRRFARVCELLHLEE